MQVIENITATLDALGIKHGALQLHAAQHNFSYTDDAYVFCKLSRPGFSGTELTLELTLANHYGPELMLQPLHQEPLYQAAGTLTIWRWEQMTNLWSDRATADECATAADLLRTLHETETPAALPLAHVTDFQFLQRKIEQRIVFAHQHGLHAGDTRLLHELYDTYLGNVHYDAVEQFVLNHGDPHFGNLVRRGAARRLCYIDYESAQLAHPEFDIASLHVNLAMLGRNLAGWAAARTRFELSPFGIDDARFDTFTIARLISMTAYGLLHPDAYDAFRERMGLLNTYYTTGNLPTYFPRVI